MNCPVCGKELYQGSKDIYQEKNNENLFACFYRKCPVSSLGYLDKSNFMELRDFTIANCIMIIKRDICDGKIVLSIKTGEAYNKQKRRQK